MQFITIRSNCIILVMLHERIFLVSCRLLHTSLYRRRRTSMKYAVRHANDTFNSPCNVNKLFNVVAA